MKSKPTKNISSLSVKQQERLPNKGSCKPLSVSAAPNALAERVKELNCLYGISNLFENQDVSLSWIMQRAVELIPAAWQYSENACARISLDGQEYTSKNFKPTRWHQNTKIVLNGKFVGEVDIYYIQPPPEVDSGPFLEEEDRLLRAIGERLSKILWLKRSEEALMESEERYRVLTEQVAEGVALVQSARFCYVNPEFCKMFNVPSAKEMVDGLVHNPPAGNADEIARLYGSRPEDGIIAAKVEEIHRLTRSEKTFWIQVCHSPITFKGRAALLSTFKDVTEIKEQQMAAQRTADLLNHENRVLRSSLKERYRFGDIIGRSPVIQEVYELILKAAATDASVAIFGESGSGKELVAHAIHDHSSRKNERFVAINCSAIQKSLFEREFFGHRKGAFSSAHADSPGYLDMADGGTLFLDEVSELTVNMQAKLLRAIEGGEYRPVGSTENISADFRIISASNTALSAKVNSGQMRNDFFYRIQVIQIQLPPLRNRKQDIPLLVEHFLRKMETPSGTARVPGHIMDILIEYDWPGNVRELRNVLQRYITLGHLEFLSPDPEVRMAPIETELNLRGAVQQLEKSLISKALRQASGNRTRAADLLGISRRALFRKMPRLECQ
ncbi:MAG: sigma-54-dependent Fis family transcriptional regulator [Desulfosarcina sp.]|nr:sigma-54-dependent Fis family transcriptional regulator [Desulfosarcina sp.]MBC2743756.1 sigma-54-dependent Fis family transcriptional regulator [Desulfosarcina sp.]MBC2766665.1 sigma-54-dependent Fis family transcriptional regulator [Desulfosarcina sp.]